MTDQTVPVPVDLARRLIASFPAHSAAHELAALIPDPPKVGDPIDATAAFALPVRSTFVDEDGDTYVVYGSGKVRRVTNIWAGTDENRWEEYEVNRPSLVFSDLTVTFVPSGD